MVTRWTVYAGEDSRVVGGVERNRFGHYVWTACVPDPWTGEAGPRMAYADGPVRFVAGVSGTLAAAAGAVAVAACGHGGPTTAGVAVDGADGLDWSGVVWNDGNMAQETIGG